MSGSGSTPRQAIRLGIAVTGLIDAAGKHISRLSATTILVDTVKIGYNLDYVKINSYA